LPKHRVQVENIINEMRNDLLEERLISDIFGVIPNLCQGRPGGDLEWSCRWLEEVEIYIGPQIPLIFGVWPAKQKKKKLSSIEMHGHGQISVDL